MRLISADGKINLSFENWDIEIVSPYLIPPVYFIKATGEKREKVLVRLDSFEVASFVCAEIEKAYEKRMRVCYISKIIERAERRKG